MIVLYQSDNPSIINCNTGENTNMNENTMKQLIEMSKFFNMKEVCGVAGVNYGTFKNWKSNPNKYYLSDEIANKLLNTMKNLTKGIK